MSLHVELHTGMLLLFNILIIIHQDNLILTNYFFKTIEQIYKLLS